MMNCPRGSQAVIVIEAGDAGHLGGGDLHQLGDGVQMGLGQVAELGLHLVQHGDQLALRIRLVRGTAR